MPVVRTFISFPAGVVRMPLRPFIVYSTAGAFLWSILLVWVGEQLGANWAQIREMLQPYDTLMIALVVVAGGLFVWWRLGMPGCPGEEPPSRRTRPPTRPSPRARSAVVGVRLGPRDRRARCERRSSSL